jgi:hypothetical protein
VESVGCVRLFEGEVGENKGKKKSSSSPASLVQGKKKTHSAIKMAPFQVFFFFNEQCMKRHSFGQNALFYLNENGAKLMSKYKSILNL